MKSLDSVWPWDLVWIRFLLWVPGMGNAVISYLLSIYLSKHYLWLLVVSVIASLMALLYAKINRRVQGRKAQLPENASLTGETLIALNERYHSPGVFAISDNNLILLPVFATKMSIALSDIKYAKTGNILKGKKLKAKTAIHLVANHKSYDFALLNPDFEKIKAYIITS